MLFIFTIIIILLWKEWKCNREDNHTHNRCYDNQWKSCFYKIHKAVTSDSHNHSICRHSDRSCISTGPPITHAINTALGSASILCAIDRQIGTINAVVAVFDIKFVITQHRRNTTSVRIYGDGSLPSAPITFSAIISPAPVFSSAAARDKVPPNKKIVFKSIDFNASFSEITPVNIKSKAPIPPETQRLIPIFLQRS